MGLPEAYPWTAAYSLGEAEKELEEEPPEECQQTVACSQKAAEREPGEALLEACRGTAFDSRVEVAREREGGRL